MIKPLAVLPLAALAAGGTVWSPPGPRGQTHLIEIRAMAFQPAELSVSRGDTIVWINRDIVPHTATTRTGALAWDTGTLAQGDTGLYVARRPGTASYICTLHPTMQGTLIIH